MMKLYSTYEKASISMGDASNLLDALSECIYAERIEYVIETGTYLGLGSTQTIAHAFLKSKPPKEFVTIEANWSNWKTARKNLSKYKYIKSLWGKSVAQDEAIRFINSDPVLRNHEKYPDIWIDDTDDPREFYIKEIRGRLGADLSSVDNLCEAFARLFYHSGEDLLKRYLVKFKEQKPLIVLDSAGGVGYLEFTILQNLMTNKSYLVLLDDVHHVKHFRSHEEIKTNSNFRILYLDLENGWLLAKHR
jgi:hypothetical protein